MRHPYSLGETLRNHSAKSFRNWYLAERSQFLDSSAYRMRSPSHSSVNLEPFGPLMRMLNPQSCSMVFNSLQTRRKGLCIFLAALLMDPVSRTDLKSRNLSAFRRLRPSVPTNTTFVLTCSTIGEFPFDRVPEACCPPSPASNCLMIPTGFGQRRPSPCFGKTGRSLERLRPYLPAANFQ